ncbi:MAG: PEP-CTERM sorting domain-containing protein [Planctomycetota bacterium]
MRGEIALIIAILTLCAASEALAVGDKAFTSSGQILPGEEWNNVSIYNDDTVVDMLGGLVDSMGTHDASTLNVFAGSVSSMGAHESSIANVSGGEVHSLWAYDGATVTLASSGIVQSLSAGGDSGVANVYGGTVEYICPVEHGMVNLYGGVVKDSLAAIDFSVVNVFGHDLGLSNSGGAYGDGQVYGFWLGDAPFTIDLNGSQTYSHIYLVPEPTSLGLLALGSLLLRRRR